MGKEDDGLTQDWWWWGIVLAADLFANQHHSHYVHNPIPRLGSRVCVCNGRSPVNQRLSSLNHHLEPSLSGINVLSMETYIKGIETVRKEIRDYPSEDHIAPNQSPALYASRSAMRRLTFGTSSNWASNSCRERFTNWNSGGKKPAFSQSYTPMTSNVS